MGAEQRLVLGEATAHHQWRGSALVIRLVGCVDKSANAVLVDFINHNNFLVLMTDYRQAIVTVNPTERGSTYSTDRPCAVLVRLDQLPQGERVVQARSRTGRERKLFDSEQSCAQWVRRRVAIELRRAWRDADPSHQQRVLAFEQAQIEWEWRELALRVTPQAQAELPLLG